MAIYFEVSKYLVSDTENKYRSVIACDTCGEHIQDANLAVAIWLSGASRIYYAHEGECKASIEEMVLIEGRRAIVQPLSIHLVELQDNTNIDVEQTKNRMYGKKSLDSSI